jgi:oligopeptide transport system permease protein
MAKYLVKRVLMACITILMVAVITFFLMNAIPGNPWLSEKTPPQATIDALNAKYGLDQPLPIQLQKYLGNLLRGDFGVSIKMMKNYPVLDIILEMFPVSARIGIIALFWALLVGVPLGCLAAYYRGRPIDSILRVVSTLGVATPEFVVAVVIMVLFTAGGVFPLLPNTFNLKDWTSYILPCFALGLYPMCYIARQTRSSMLDAISQEYIKTARAKGLRTSKIIFKHALRNALIPVITYLGPLTAFVLSGGFVVEKVFSVPGLGRYFVQSILNRDYPIIMGTAIFLASFIILMNLVVDILYRVVDPRIDITKGGN